MTKKFRTELDHPRDYCFVIDYGNNNYCILSNFGSGYIYYSEQIERMDFEYKKLDFNKEEFITLLNKYLNNLDL